VSEGRGSPGQWAAYLAVRALSGALGRLPIDRSLAAGAALGRTWARLGGPRTEVARRNLRLAFPGWDEAKRERILVDSFANFGRVISELSLLQGPARDALVDGVRIEGLEHYEAARRESQNGGVFVVTAHFGSWELAGTAFVRQVNPVSVVHHVLDNPGLDAMVAKSRRDSGFTSLELGRAGLSVLRALRRGQTVVVLMDQNASRSEGVFAPFFSRLASTRPGVIQIACRSGAALVPAFCFREGESAGHRVRFCPAIELAPDGDDPDAALLENVTRVNRVIERAIEQAPDHWLWGHKRWKTRPGDEAAREDEGALERIYPDRRSARRCRSTRSRRFSPGEPS
jgi:KDO2-lipid IV(A) lauroyltransferase